MNVRRDSLEAPIGNYVLSSVLILSFENKKNIKKIKIISKKRMSKVV